MKLVSQEHLDLMKQGQVMCADGKPHDIAKLLPAVVIGMARRYNIYSAHNNASGTIARQMREILDAEIKRRDLPMYSKQLVYQNERFECHVKDCSRTALYAVGILGFCKVHKGRALLLKRKTAQKQEAKMNTREAEWKANVKDYKIRAGSRLTWDGK